MGMQVAKRTEQWSSGLSGRRKPDHHDGRKELEDQCCWLRARVLGALSESIFEGRQRSARSGVLVPGRHPGVFSRDAKTEEGDEVSTPSAAVPARELRQRAIHQREGVGPSVHAQCVKSESTWYPGPSTRPGPEPERRAIRRLRSPPPVGDDRRGRFTTGNSGR